MDQSVDPILKFNESSKIRQVAYAAVHLGTDRISKINRAPGIVLELFHAEADALLNGVDAKNLNLNVLSFLKQLLRARSAFGPRYLRHMHETLNAGFELDEDTVVGNRRYLAGYPRIDGVNLDHRRPRIRKKLFVTERDLFFLAV